MRIIISYFALGAKWKNNPEYFIILPLEIYYWITISTAYKVLTRSKNNGKSIRY